MTPSNELAPPTDLPSLSVVIPVYNEPVWVRRTVPEVVHAVRRSSFADPELVIVDDGSDAETKAALAELAPGIRCRIISQENQGRFAARRTGIEAASGRLVLLIDARVSIDSEALAFVGSQWSDEKSIWNGHCEIDTAGNPYARFWDTITRAAFLEYFANPRTASFGPAEFDRYPKGTTLFLAPRAWLLEVIESFSSMYDDPRFSNDDTNLIRRLADRQPISISPGFSGLYRSRTDLRQFLRHAFHRGTVFFDGFARPETRFFPVVVAVFPATLAALWLTVRRPKWILGLAGLSPLAAVSLAKAYVRRPWADAAAFGALVPPFALVYVAGIWRGALLALRTRLRGRRRDGGG